MISAREENSEKGELVSYFYQEDVAKTAKELLEKIFHADTSVTPMVRAGRQTFALRCASSAIRDFLRKADEGARKANFLVGFRCPSCEVSFLRGVFLASGSVTDPLKAYHLEFSLVSEGRARLIAECLAALVSMPGKARRGTRVGLYYKGNATISDLLYLLGSSGQGFAVANACIERDIRNYEHRVTNCEASNISRSVLAAQKQLSAIERLYETRRIDTLAGELRQTAELRRENPSASLAELASMHTPPITKSGLNGRLKKLIEAAEESDLT